MVTGPIFKFSDTWQWVINTGTTIVTFLMVFLIQNTQNRDSEATQIKLDELIRAVKGAHNALLDLEELEDEELDRMRAYYERIAERARGHLRAGIRDAGAPEVESHEIEDIGLVLDQEHGLAAGDGSGLKRAMKPRGSKSGFHRSGLHGADCRLGRARGGRGSTKFRSRFRASGGGLGPRGVGARGENGAFGQDHSRDHSNVPGL